MLYYLKLSLMLQRLYLVFLMVEHTAFSDNPISKRHFNIFPDPVIIDGEEEWKVEKILYSH